jgi:hypothetical protein
MRGRKPRASSNRQAGDAGSGAKPVLTTTASYLSIVNNLTRSQATTASDPTVKRQTAYFLANIGKVKTISDFVNNYQLFSYAMKAYGLEDMIYAKGMMTKVLEGGVTDSKALANTLTDKRFKAFATAFDFVGQGAAATTTAAATTGTTTKYIEQSLEDNVGQQNQGVKLALYFKRTAASVTNAYGLLADPALLKVVQTAFGLSPNTSQSDIDVQARQVSKLINISDLQDPKKVEKLVERFTAMWDLSGNNTASSTTLTTASLFDSSTTLGISSDLLLSMQNLKLGGN